MLREFKSAAMNQPFGEKLIAFVNFGLIGCIGLVVDFLVTWIFKDQLNVNSYIANTCGFSFAVIVNFILNKRWTFKDKSNQYLKQFGSFVVISLVGLALNTGFLFLFHEGLTLNFYISKAFATVLVFFWNFFANSFFTFRRGIDFDEKTISSK